MLRAFLILIILANPDGSLSSVVSATHPSGLGSLPAASRFSETALSQPLIWVAHAREAIAYATRRMIEPYTWAIAGVPRTRVQVWEFEPALQRPASSNLRSEDRDPRSGSGPSDWYWTDRAISLVKDVRQNPMPPKPLSKGKRSLQGKLFGILVAEGIPTELARRFAHRVAQRRYFDDTMTWKALGQLLVREVDQLRRVGLPDHEIAASLPKLSADDVQKLWEWLKRADRSIASTLFARAVEAADPIYAAHVYLDHYRMAFRAALKIDPARAATLAGQVFAMRDALKKIKAKIKKKFEAQIQPDRSKWTLLLIAAAAFTGWLGSGDAFMAHKDSWLPALILFGPLWPPGSFTKIPRGSFEI